MNIEQHLINGDSAEVLKTLKDNSIDLLATDPPYGIQFMGLDFDKALPPKQVWEECYRVLKPGSFIAVMSSPRSDVLYRMIKDLEDAGFDMSFSPLLWTYHTGFPKASDTSKMIDKRAGAERKVVGSRPHRNTPNSHEGYKRPIDEERLETGAPITISSTDLAKKYEGSKLGFQPKPAVEHIIIGMKPHGSKSYIDNVLNFEALPDNIKMTYPFIQVPKPAKKEKDLGLTGSIEIFTPTIKLVYLLENNVWEKEDLKTKLADTDKSLQKVIDASIIMEDNKWNIESFGNYIMEQLKKEHKSITEMEINSTTIYQTLNSLIQNHTRTYIAELFGERVKDIKFVEDVKQKSTTLNITIQNKDGYSPSVSNVELIGLWSINIAPSKSSHPTTKPVKLMSYIITLFTREGDWVIDPFLGSGTTGIASKLINRNFIGVEREKEYFDICEERLSVSREELVKFFKMEQDTQTKLDL